MELLWWRLYPRETQFLTKSFNLIWIHFPKTNHIPRSSGRLETGQWEFEYL